MSNKRPRRGSKRLPKQNKRSQPTVGTPNGAQGKAQPTTNKNWRQPQVRCAPPQRRNPELKDTAQGERKPCVIAEKRWKWRASAVSNSCKASQTWYSVIGRASDRLVRGKTKLY